MQPHEDTQKVSHPLKLRLLTVTARRMLGPDLVRITLSGPDLAGFHSPGFDDHVKLIIPDPGQKVPRLPQLGERGVVFPVGQPKPAMRDYTPRAWRAHEQELDIDFVLHGEGPACQWAAAAQTGDKLGVAGPRGSFLISTTFDWHVLIGDETAVPAMARRLKELPAQAKVQVFVLARNLLTLGALEAPEHVPVNWVPSLAGQAGLLDAVRAAPVLEGRGYVWIAAESAAAKALRQYWVQERGHDKNLVRASSYWRQGDAAVHEHHD